MNKLSSKKLLIIIVILTAFLRLFRLDYPNAYVFDEVYHGFTAKEYLKGNKSAWDPFTTPPPGVAYEWTHPPLAKELMTVSMFIFRSTDAWTWRLPGALLGILSMYLIYLLAKKLFNNEWAALISAFLFSIDGLNYVQSRTGMNDIYVVTFMLLSLLFLLNKRYLISSIFFGLAISSKWSAIYYLGMVVIIMFYHYIKDFKHNKIYNFLNNLLKFSYFIFIPLLIYLASYIPYFLQNYNWNQFVELHRQMYYYHTHLKATHDYASPWWSWPLNLHPVWYYVQYYPNNWLSNIFASGNPLLFWMGSGSIILTIWDFLKTKSYALMVILLGFFVFWLPWAISPRIMFLYHFSPSVPFLSLALGYQLNTLFDQSKNKKLMLIILGLIFVSFLIVYPMLTGIPLPKNLMLIFFNLNATKNPFGS